jgi:histidinol phosphatase-like enzyme
VELTNGGRNPRFGLVTNQGGVAFGFQTKEQVWEKLGRIVTALDFFYGQPFSVHVSLYHPDATVPEWRCEAGSLASQRRKPSGRMLVEAMERHRVDQLTTVMVGDLDTDHQAADAAKVVYYDAKEFFQR